MYRDRKLHLYFNSTRCVRLWVRGTLVVHRHVGAAKERKGCWSSHHIEKKEKYETWRLVHRLRYSSGEVIPLERTAVRRGQTWHKPRAKKHIGTVEVANWERCNHCQVSFVGWSVRRQYEHKQSHTLNETLALPREEEAATLEGLREARINRSARQAMKQQGRQLDRSLRKEVVRKGG